MMKQFLKHALCAIALLLAIASVAEPAALIVTVDTTITTPMTYDSVVVQSGATLTANAQISVTGNMRIASGGKLTHSPYPINSGAGLSVIVSGSLVVESGASISTLGRGLRGGKNGSVFGQIGEAWNSTGTAVVSGSTGGSGGSYGGLGGLNQGAGYPASANQSYGFIEEPNLFGSGGGGQSNALYAGNGGGRIAIVADSLVVNGTIDSDGQDKAGGGNCHGIGGGSGGAIKISCRILAGSGSGIISARGGVGYLPSECGAGGGGGGGRIAIYAADLAGLSNVTVRANGGITYANGTSGGGAGTIFLKDSSEAYGEVIVDNNSINNIGGTPVRTNLGVLKSFTVTSVGRATASDSYPAWSAEFISVSGGTLYTQSNLVLPVITSLQLTGGGVIDVDGNSTISVPDFTTDNFVSGTVVVRSGASLDIASDSLVIGSGVTLTKDGRFNYGSGTNDSIDIVTVKAGGTLTHSQRFLGGLRLNVVMRLEVQAGGAIDLNLKGLSGGSNGSVYGALGEAFDQNGNIISGSAGSGYTGSGGSHGGVAGIGDHGTSGYINAPYGLIESPQLLGASGSAIQVSPTYAPGNHGGGRALIRAANCIVDGSIRANGGNAYNFEGARWGGAGAGGSILMELQTLSGTGLIQANGGISNSGGGSGGGGRIAVYYAASSLTYDQYQAFGGSQSTNSRKGGAGTIYLKESTQAYGDLIIDNNGAVAASPSPNPTFLTEFRNVYVRRSGAVRLLSEVLVHGELDCSDGGWIGR